MTRTSIPASPVAGREGLLAAGLPPQAMEHWRIFARAELALVATADARPALLLEGTWPAGRQAPTGGQLALSLDDAIDARHAKLDVEAQALTEALVSATTDGGLPSFADIHALALRYYSVQLLRGLALADDHWPQGVELELTAEAGRDDHYAELFTAIAAARGGRLSTRWSTPEEATLGGSLRHRTSLPPNPWWRRWAGRLLSGSATASRNCSPRILLCGNPRLLDPVCGGLLAQGAQPAWLFDRFAIRPWRRWHRQGVGQFCCNSSLGRQSRFTLDLATPVLARGVDLSAPLKRWLRARAAAFGAAHTRLVEQVDACFARFRPQALVLDEDATPLARIAVHAARRHGATSIVLQHGAPYVRFGFAPLAADRICVWGESSRQRLLGWGVPDQQIVVAGAPHLEAPTPAVSHAPQRANAADAGPRLLLLATLPPRDDRPDSVAFHLTTSTHRRMLAAALALTNSLSGARLTVKLHPRTANDSEFRQAFGGHPRARIIRAGDLAALIAQSHLVLSCASSAGVEATQTGVPVIQLLPAGSDEVLPAADWGFYGTARTEAELLPLARQALASATATPPPAKAFVEQGVPAASTTVAEILRLAKACRAGP